MSQTVRTSPCSAADAQNRFTQARKFAEVARLVADEGHDVEFSSAATSLCVLAGIAASDAACCKELGERARGQDHREAAELLERVEPGGREVSQSLRKLLNVKDKSQYAFTDVGGSELRAALRQAESLLTFAEGILAR